MSQENIQVFPRSTTQNLHSLRTQGIIPGIMYGQSLKKSVPIQINVKDLQRIIDNRANTTTFVVDYEGTPHECILREYQTDQLHTAFLHVDLQYVKDDEIIKMNIPMSYDGLEYLSGKKLILEKAISRIPVVGPIQNLPESFVLNVGELDHGSKIFAHQITLPDDTELLLNPETIIATIQ